MILEGCDALRCTEVHKGTRAGELVRLLQGLPTDAFVLVNRVNNLLVLDATADRAYATAKALGYVDLAFDSYHSFAEESDEDGDH